FYGGKCAWQKLRPTQISNAPFLTQNVNDLTANFIAREGALRQGNNQVLIEFRDRNGQLVDVGNVKFDMDMNMPGMQMHSGSTIERTTLPAATAPKSRSTCPAIGARRFLSKARTEKPNGGFH